MSTFVKAPTAILDYQMDYTTWLQGDQIAVNGSTWVVPSGITKQSDSATTNKTTIWLADGLDSMAYDCFNTIVTVGGRRETRTLTILVISVRTGALISELRRRVNELTDATYSDGLLLTYLWRYALPDSFGTTPQLARGNVNALGQPIIVVNPTWVPTYDLAAAAADIWSEKAAAIAHKFTFTSDNATYQRSMAVQQAEQQARYWRSRRSPNAIHLSPSIGSIPPFVDGLYVNAGS